MSHTANVKRALSRTEFIRVKVKDEYRLFRGNWDKTTGKVQLGKFATVPFNHIVCADIEQGKLMSEDLETDFNIQEMELLSFTSKGTDQLVRYNVKGKQYTFGHVSI